MGRNKLFFHWKRGIAKRAFSLVLVFAMIAALIQTMPGLQTVWAADDDAVETTLLTDGDESVVVDDTEDALETEGEPVTLADSPAVTVEGKRATFTVVDESATKIEVAGDFTDPTWGAGKVLMTKNGTTFTYTTGELADGQYSFKFIRDGEWDPDPNQTFTVGVVVDPAVVSGTSVTFTVVDENATKITVPGDFNGWDTEATPMTKGADDTFTCTVSNLAPGKYGYKFHRDGNWDSGENRTFWIEGISAPTSCKVVRGGNTYTLPTTFPKYVTGQDDPEQVSVTSYSMDPVAGVTFDSAAKTLKVDGSCDVDELTLTATVEGQSITLKVAVIDEPITLRVHYIRTDKNYTGWDCYTWESGAESKVFTVVGDEGVAEFQIDGRQYMGFNYIIRKGGDSWTAKDVDADQRIDFSDIISGTIDYYITSGVPGGRYEYGQDVVRGVKIGSVEYKSGKVIVTVGVDTAEVVGDPAAIFSIKDEEGNPVTITGTEASGKQFTLTVDVDMSGLDGTQKKYFLVYEGFEYEISVASLFSSEEFEELYTYDGDDLGATWSQSGTTFKVWAPTATALNVKLYASGTKDTEDLESTVAMTKGEKGVWTVTVAGDLNGTYYTYEATVDGETVEVCDPYARTTGVNGNRAMVIDLDSTDPEGWDSDVSPNEGMAYTDAVIYELHVRDFSIDDSSGISAEHKGKFLGLTETGTTNATGQATGLDYLKDLGVTHIHLLPFYDYGSVDETRLNEPQFNWGYDPVNYNVPEGSYSTDPYNGEVRVSEAKQMVKALHENNINVIMDVVYNHVQDANTFAFNQLVPQYFSRPGSNGSGCGNDTASERSMVKKYIVDSVNYWADEYHIDGFRFDLVGLLDTETINEIVSTVHENHPNVIFYGEGWTLPTNVTKEGYTLATQTNSAQTPDFAYFSDTMRDMIKGSVFEAEGTGYVSGAQNQENQLIACFTANTNWSSNPTQAINYASCHDNYTLFDKLTLSATGATEEELIKMNNLAAAIYMTAEGIPLIHAGEEILRTKPYVDEDGETQLEHNSYNKPDSVNSIKWATLNEEKYQNTRDYYKGLIAFRKEHAALRMTTAEEIAANIKSDKVANNVVMFTIKEPSTARKAGESIVVIFNSNKAEQDINLADYGLSGTWKVYINDEKAGTEVLDTITDGHATVAPISAMVLVQDTVNTDVKDPVKDPDVSVVTGNLQYDGWAGVSAEQKAKLMQESLAQNAAVTAPKTNDNAPIAMVIMLLMAGAVAVAGAVGKKRKLG